MIVERATSREWVYTTLHITSCVAFVLLLFVAFYPIGLDYAVFHNARLTDPHATAWFVTPPWTLFFLPHTLLPIEIGNAVNLLLNLVAVMWAIRRLGGDWKALLLAFTCPVFAEFVRVNNVDWIGLFGLAAGPFTGAFMLTAKPQVFGGAILVWAKRDRRLLFIPVGLFVASLLAWGWWPGRLTINPVEMGYNLAVFPIGVPLGIWLLKKAWDEDDAVLGAVATPLLTPYISASSLAVVFAVVAARWPRAAKWLYFAIWCWTVIAWRRM